MADRIPIGAIVVGGAVAGAVYYFTRTPAGTDVAPNLNPFRSLRESANQREDKGIDLSQIRLDRTVINVVRPAVYAIVGCGRRWAMPIALVRGARQGGGDLSAIQRGRAMSAGYSGVDEFFPPEFVSGCRAPSAGRPWFIPVYKADRDLDRAGAGYGGPSSPVPPVEYVEGTDGYARAPAVQPKRETVPGFLHDGAAWVRSTSTRNFAVIDARRKSDRALLRLYVSNRGWTAWDNRGKNVPAAQVEITYRGRPVPAEVNPFAVEPWAGADRAPGNGKIWADANPALPWDLIGPPWVAAFMSLGHKPMPDVRI